MPPKEIDLSNETGLLLIVLNQNAPLVTNQTGGYRCNHPVVRGITVELNIGLLDNRLDDGWTSGDSKMFLDANPALGRSFESDGHGEEAWWPVKFIGTDIQAIITYENSD